MEETDQIKQAGRQTDRSRSIRIRWDQFRTVQIGPEQISRSERELVIEQAWTICAYGFSAVVASSVLQVCE
jgi:hypothetical protein